MDEYVVGSIAELISNKKCLNTKPKKGKLKRKEQVSGGNSDIITDGFLYTFKVKSADTNLEKVGTKKNITEEVKSEAMGKKRKKEVDVVSGAAEADVLPKRKKHKKCLENPDVNPNYSEEEEQGNTGSNPKQKDKIFVNKRLNEDFNKNTIFIGNVPISYDKKKLCKMFSAYGEIQSARIRCVPIAKINMSKKVAAIKKQFNTKRNSVVAYVKYKSENSAKAALEANGMIIDGHHLRVDLAQENKGRDNSKAVFVGGLSFDIEDDELWEFFQNCGKIESVRVIRDSHTTMGKGFGYVNFDSIAAVELALQLDGQKLKKQTINIKRCVKPRNKNKLNSFDRKKCKENFKLTNKRSKKCKEEIKKLKTRGSKSAVDFQGRKANMKHKKKKKLSKTALRQRKLVKVLGSA